MNGTCGCFSRNNSSGPRRLRPRWIAPLLATCIAMGTSGCGGGSGGGGAAAVTPAATPSADPGRGTVAVTVKDVLGAPVPRAEVGLYTIWPDEDKRAIADLDGRVEFRDVRSGRLSLAVSGPDAYGRLNGVTLDKDARLNLQITLHPASSSTGGIARAALIPGSVSADGRSAGIALRFVHVPHPNEGEYDAWGGVNVAIRPCAPDTQNDADRFRADCVVGAAGYDVAYAEARAQSVTLIPGKTARPYAVAVLMDQGTRVIVGDSDDARLFATKYFVTRMGANDRFALAAFASDDVSSGQPALLPQQPVTMFPVGNPQLSADGRALFGAIDGLSTLEGGASPLFAALTRTIDFLATNSPGGLRRMIVVVTDGLDDACGPPAACAQEREAVVARSREKSVEISTIGLSTLTEHPDRAVLARLTEGGEGAAFWALNPTQLAPVMGAVHEVVSGTRKSYDATFRIESSTAGAFSSGHTVLGMLQLEVCPWDCTRTNIPFAVRIP